MTRHPLLYDPDCGFCRVCVALLLTWDRGRRLRPVALTDPEAERLLQRMPESERMASWHLVGPRWLVSGAKNDTDTNHLAIWSAGAAFPELFRLLPGARPLARLTGSFPAPSERAYRWVADHRSALGKPIPAAVKRWADRVISESQRRGR